MHLDHDHDETVHTHAHTHADGVTHTHAHTHTAYKASLPASESKDSPKGLPTATSVTYLSPLGLLLIVFLYRLTR